MFESLFSGLLKSMTLYNLLSGIVVPFLAAFVTTSLIHHKVREMAVKKNMTDAPNGRKLQKEPIPVMGGFAIYFGILTGVGITCTYVNTYALFSCIVALTVMMYVGILDDMVGLSPIVRILMEVLTILFIIFLDRTSINDMHGLFGIGWFPSYISIPFCLVACVGIINAVNMIDGVNGLSSGLCLLGSVCFGLLFFFSGSGSMSAMAALMAGSLIPFFVHNVFGIKSKMFIGDSGTMMMGIMMSIFCMRMIDESSLVALHHPNLGVVAFCLSVLSVPVFDTLRVMTHRIKKGVSPFHPDRTHLHHMFIDLGFSHFGTMIMIISMNIVNILCWLISYLCGFSPTGQFIVVASIGVFNTFVVYYFFCKLNRTHRIYKIMRKISGFTYFELNPLFTHIRRIVDRL